MTPTREQIAQAIDHALNETANRRWPGATWFKTPAHYIDVAADEVLALIESGPAPRTKTDKETP